MNSGNESLKSLGFIVNPIAGMGGAVGLKGTDGRETLEKALALGAKPVAPKRAQVFLRELVSAKKGIILFTAAGRMGEDESRKLGYTPKVTGKAREATSPRDTRKSAMTMREKGLDLLVFCGGDGTARDILDSVGREVPALGVPTGVKMHSSVFAVDPISAARIVKGYFWGNLPLREGEVMDVDEEAFREGAVSSKIYGYLLTPYEPALIQASKVASLRTDNELRNQAAIALYVLEEMIPEVVYIVGPGTTTRTIGDLLEEKKTLLGVDMFQNKKMVARDANERIILEEIEGKDAKIIVTPIGGQGFIFGRGNQQISPRVIRRVGLDNVIVIATRNKIRGLEVLRVDSGDPRLDEEIRGYLRVITDYKEERVMKVR